MYPASRMRHIGNSGFTIAEMLVAVLVGLLIMAGLYRMFVAGLATQTTATSEVEVVRKAQVVMDDIAFRLRQSAPSTLYGWPAILEDADPQYPDRIHFAAPPGSNLEPDPTAEVRYWLRTGALRRKIGGNNYTGGEVLAGDVSQLVFTFYRYDASANLFVPTDLAAETVAVKVQLTITEGKVSSTLESTVRLRNMSNRA